MPGDAILFPESDRSEKEGSGADDVVIVDKVMLVNDVVKVKLGKGRTEVVRRFDTERWRLRAIRHDLGIELRREKYEEIQEWDMSVTQGSIAGRGVV